MATMGRIRLRTVASALCVAGGLVVVGCGSTDEVDHAHCTIDGKSWGGVVGATAGALAGAAIASRTDHTGVSLLGGFVGSVGGYILGRELGSMLDDCEQAQIAQATLRALETPHVGLESTQQWNSKSRPDVAGSVIVTGDMPEGSERQCRQAASIVNVMGEDTERLETYCRDPITGTWQLQEL